MRPIHALLTMALILIFVTTADACPTCKLAVEGGTDHSQQGYAYSIMFMIAMPFLIALGWTLFIYRSVQKAKQLAPVQV